MCLGKCRRAVGSSSTSRLSSRSGRGQRRSDLNTTPLPAKIYANEGIAQVLFFQVTNPARSRTDKKGKPQAAEVTLPRFELSVRRWAGARGQTWV